MCAVPSAALRSADGYKLGLNDWRFDSRFPAPHAYACDSSYLEYTPILIASFSEFSRAYPLLIWEIIISSRYALCFNAYFLATRTWLPIAQHSIDNFCNMVPMVRVLGSTVTTVDALIRRGGEDGPRSEALALTTLRLPDPASHRPRASPSHWTRDTVRGTVRHSSTLSLVWAAARSSPTSTARWESPSRDRAARAARRRLRGAEVPTSGETRSGWPSSPAG